jgi:hypothetical protein
VPTPEIFDFDADGLDAYDEARVADALERHPTVYVNHLRIAQHIAAAASDLEAQRSDADDADDTDDGRYAEGYVAALRAVVTALRQADYVPSGRLLTDEHRTGRFKAR